MKNFILTGIFIVGVAIPVLAIVVLSPAPTINSQQPRQSAVVMVFDDEAAVPPPVISYDFSNGHIPSTQFVALDRHTYSDGALAIKVMLPYMVHPQFWTDVFKEMPTVPDWLPVMTSVRSENRAKSTLTADY